MLNISHFPRLLAIAGFAAMLLGLVDPLEGSPVLLVGCGLTVLSAFIGHSRHRSLLMWSFGLMLLGISAMWGVSAIGGFGGTSGRSNWWGVLLLPYPVGWLMGLVGAFRRLKELNVIARPS